MKPALGERGQRKEAFETEFGGWIAAHNDWVDTNGIPGVDLRPW